MGMIDILKPKTAKPDKLTIDIVVNLPSGRHRIQNLKYDKEGLYRALTTHKKGVVVIDIHTSYHPRGEIHSKLTRGKLRQATAKFGNVNAEPPQIETLGNATPNDRDTAIVLETEQGIPLDSIKGVVEIYPAQQGVHHIDNIAVIAANYPILRKTHADYVFEIEGETTPWINIKYFFVEPDNESTLEARIQEIINRGNNFESKITLRPRMFESLEKAVLFTNLTPWLGIVLLKFGEKREGSESFQSAQPQIFARI